jgi:hypothetical protein
MRIKIRAVAILKEKSTLPVVTLHYLLRKARNHVRAVETSCEHSIKVGDTYHLALSRRPISSDFVPYFFLAREMALREVVCSLGRVRGANRLLNT